ncbi:uncharacterized protein BT62DRAFT_901268, partial [Guyanagaster necrorhizus]
KWDSRFMLSEDYEDSLEQIDEGFKFDWRVTIKGSIMNIFCIFTEVRCAINCQTYGEEVVICTS